MEVKSAQQPENSAEKKQKKQVKKKKLSDALRKNLLRRKTGESSPHLLS